MPNSFSSVALGGAMDVGEQEPPELHRMSDRETDIFIRRCAVALQSHGSDFHSGHGKEDALSAFESTMALLLEVRDVYPAKRASIDQILVRFGYPVPEN